MWCSIIGVILLLIGFIGALTLRTEWGIALGIIGIAGAAITTLSCIRLMTHENTEEDDDEEPISSSDAPSASSPSAAPAETAQEEEAPLSPEPASAPLKSDTPEPTTPAEATEPKKPEQLKEAAEPSPQPSEAPTPYEQPSPYRRGLRYLCAADQKNALRKAAGCFVDGYEKGDLNAGYMLCHCYSEGKGVPVKPVFVVQLAEYLVKRRYYPAYHHLAVAYREGRGAPMNLALASEYSQKFEDLCSTPIEGVDELVRYDALIDHETRKDNPDLRILEKLARENFAISPLPSRYSVLALALLRDAACSASARAEALHLLEEGSKANDMGCYYLRGLLLSSATPLLYNQDIKRGLDYLRVAALRLGTPTALQSYLYSIQDPLEAEEVSIQLRNVCRWGISGIKGSDELYCRISLISPERPKPDEKSPLIFIENESDTTLRDAILRICCIDKKTEFSLRLAPLPARESLIISPSEQQIELGNQLYIEVHKDKLSSRMVFRHVDVLQKFSAHTSLLH